MTPQPGPSPQLPSSTDAPACYLCGSADLEQVRDRLRHGIRRNVLACRSCGLVFLESVRQDLRTYYEDEYRKQYSPVVGRKLSSREIFEMNLPHQQTRIDRIAHLLRPDMRVLDVGCSAGFFLHALRPHVGACIGIEFNREDAAFVADELGIPTFTTPVEETDLDEGSFDLITAFHVVEHLDDPRAVLTTLRRYLKPGGHVVFEVPNVDDALLSVYSVEPYADFWYREPHLFNFSPRTFTDLMRQSGYTGDTFTIQRYSLVNHLNWILTGAPQPSFRAGTETPRLAAKAGVDKTVAADVDAFFARINAEYKALLNRHGRGDCVVFIGQADAPR